MLVAKNSFYVNLMISVILIVVLTINNFSTCYEKNTILENVAISTLSANILSIITSTNLYFIEKKYVITQILNKILKILSICEIGNDRLSLYDNEYSVVCEYLNIKNLYHPFKRDKKIKKIFAYCDSLIKTTNEEELYFYHTELKFLINSLLRCSDNFGKQ